MPRRSQIDWSKVPLWHKRWKSEPGFRVPTLQRLERVAAVVESLYGFDPGTLRANRSRMTELAHARHLAFYLVRRLSRASLNQIAAYYGCDHSTVLQGVRHVQKSLRADQRVHELVQQAIDLIVIHRKPASGESKTLHAKGETA